MHNNSATKLHCFDCAYCSESYPSFIDSCDRDGRVIADVFVGWCDKAVPSEETLAELRRNMREESCTLRQIT